MRKVYFRDATIPNVTLPEANGGDGPRRYTLDPPLPPGLTFNPATRVLSGTPAETLGPTRFSYTVRDADDDMDIRTFMMSVSTISLEADAQELARVERTRRSRHGQRVAAAAPALLR